MAGDSVKNPHARSTGATLGSKAPPVVVQSATDSSATVARSTLTG
jgi:hypothetical protein